MFKTIVDENRETEREMEFMDLEDVTDEIVTMSPAIIDDDDDYDEAMASVWNFIQSLIDRLPNVWKHDIDWTEVEVATNGYELLFKYEGDCEDVASLLDFYVFGSNESHTGEYNREDDERCDCVDANTGWFYIDWD